LLLPLNNTPNVRGILTGKLFEYLAARRPILCLGPADGDCAEVILNANAGVVVDFKNEEQLKNEILSFYDRFKAGHLMLDANSIAHYSRQHLTSILAGVLDRLLGKAIK
jgi:hypothetical protein